VWHRDAVARRADGQLRLVAFPEGTVVGDTDHHVLVDPDPAKMDRRPPLIVPWWLLEVLR
jgi:hypothetical protein